MSTPSLLPGSLRRARRHLRLSVIAQGLGPPRPPPFLTLFVNSICNLTCDHCFYWRNLNQRDDLTFAELEALSADLGRLENINLSGGEPFIRKDLAEVVTLFVKGNGARQIYVPSSGFFPERTDRVLRQVLADCPELELFAVELSLDGMPAYHDQIRGHAESFDRAMQTYDVLAALQAEDPRVRVHTTSVTTDRNIEELRSLSSYLFDRCPRMDHHHIAAIRGERKDPSLKEPRADLHQDLWRHVQRLWAPRAERRFGGLVEPLLQWSRVQTLEQKRQVIPCKAGLLSGVVHANGDVGLCEQLPPIGNLRSASFSTIWSSDRAQDLRARIAAKECWCTNETFIWPSVTYHPPSFARAVIGSRAWRGPRER